jgi:site-specific DNA-cytosine methylase
MPGLRVLELFCGIGGTAAALPAGSTVTAALDINEVALGVYRANLPHPAHACALDSLSPEDPRLRGADLWWLSPPCQPYTRRGLGRDLGDRRSAALVHLVALLGRHAPPAVAVENVPEFRGSAAHRLLQLALERGGYAVAERTLCPTELGVPNRRRRFYLLASRVGLAGWASGGHAVESRPAASATASPPALPGPVPLARRLGSYLDPESHPELAVEPALLRRWARAVDIVDADDPEAVAATFTSAYGRSPVRAGSYLRQAGTVRHFHPGEVLRLLGFPATFRFPAGMTLGSRWRLAGNSLSVPAVRELLAGLPLAATRAADPPGTDPPAPG